MYFRNVFCTVALATLASAAVAKQIPTPYSATETYEDAVDDEVFERDAEAEAARTAVWEQAHGGTAPAYHYGEEHDEAAWHVARDAEAEPGWKNANGGQPPAWLAQLKSKATSATEAVKNAVPTVKPFTKQSGGLKKHHGSHKMHKHGKQHTRDVDAEEEDDYEFDDEDQVLHARDFNDPVPDFGDQDVDTSLEGLLEARDADGEEEPVNPDLDGYDEEILQRRSDGTADEVDYSLEGYDDVEDYDDNLDPVIQARSLNEDNEYDEYLRSEEHRSLLESIGVTKRDAEDDFQDEDEFDEELYARDAESDGLVEDGNEDEEDDDVDYEALHARDVVDDDVQEYDIDDADEDLYARDVVDDDVPEFDIDDDAIDTSLDGLDGSPIHARGVDEEDLEDDEDVDSGADAAYDDAEVVEELVAPVLG
jgi:hypothetical protein